VIDSLEPTEEDLPSVLGSVRSRLEPRLARHGLRFAWQVTDLPRRPGFGPEKALQAMRVVQEAVTNVVKHAGARTVTVRTGEAPGDDGRRGVFVEVVDDGRGIAPDAPRGPRAREHGAAGRRIGGTVGVRSDRGGTVVRLWLPCETQPKISRRSVVELHEAQGQRFVDRLAARVHGELLVDAAHVRRHRVRRHTQAAPRSRRS
jgi:signal transduction histidine kinase